MKFGKTLNQERKANPKFGNYFIAYKDLKKAIKHTANELRDVDKKDIREAYASAKARFVELLENEMSKINKFIDLEHDIIASQQMSLRRGCKTFGNEKDLTDFEAKILDSIRDVNALVAFPPVNETGFRKITKKFDKHCCPKDGGYPIGNFMLKVLDQKYIDFDVFLSNISDVYCHWRRESTRFKNMKSCSQKSETIDIEPPHEDQEDVATLGSMCSGVQGGGEEARKLYWISPANTLSIKCRILRHMRIKKRHVKDLITGWNDKGLVSTPTTTLYFDTEDLANYQAQVHRGATYPKISWTTDSKSALVEWKGMKAVLSKTEVSQLFAKEMTQARSSLSSEQEIEKQALVTAMHQAISEGMRPFCRCVYRRTEFESDQGNRHTLALEEDIKFILEEPGSKWNRNIGGAYIANELSPFRYAVLYIHGSTKPIVDLIEDDDPGAVEMPRFSKGTYGIATVYPKKVPFPPQSIPSHDATAIPYQEERKLSTRPRRKTMEKTEETKPSIWTRLFLALEADQDLQVDVKTFLAHERTLLRWLHTVTLLSTLSMTLMNMTESRSAIISGQLLALLTVTMAGVAFSDYYRRGKAVMQRSSSYQSTSSMFIAFGALFGIGMVYAVTLSEYISDLMD